MNLRDPKILFALGLASAVVAVFLYNLLAGRQTMLWPSDSFVDIGTHSA